MKRGTYLAGLLGLAILTALIVHEGYRDIVRLLEQAGWDLLWIVPFHAVPLILDAEGWWVLLRPRDPEGYATRPFLVWIATIREAISRLLPVLSIGGEIVGIRLALLRPLNGAAVAASVILEVLLTLINQYLFTALGLVLLVTTVSDTALAGTLFWGLLVSVPVPIALALLLRYGSPFTQIARFTERLLGDQHRLVATLGVAAVHLDAEIRALYQHHGRLWAGLAWQLAAMVVGAFETWLILHLVDWPVTVANAIMLESLWLTIRHLAFFVPGALGVQETGLVLIGGLIGLPSEAAIALSLAKRFRELVIGLPALASWQWVEFHQLRRKLGDPPVGPRE
ncbi:lysylphosphatidylglycerol synthase domain-containing protein [Candidatus Methylocalor cossyra]|uniref:Predicted integral membrane protein n=1 Tax=Candidatus Methylocalor cossyra TaxID=3108543 RepID=A0ABM9NLS9_9GAMM